MHLLVANSVHFGDWKSVPVAEGLVAFVLTAEGATASAGRLRRRVSRQVKSVRFCKRPTYSRSLVQFATSELTEPRTSLLVSRTSSHDGDGLVVPRHFSFGRARPESSSRTETAPSATMQKRGGVVQVVVGSRIHAIAQADAGTTRRLQIRPDFGRQLTDQDGGSPVRGRAHAP